jgi:hypothetical protein
MSNRAYLTASDADTIYPSFAQKGYDAPKQLIASDVENTPLLWLALFREGDLRRTTFEVEGEEVPAFAPICSKEKALEQLDRAIPYLSDIFPDLGPLSGYGEMFRYAIEQIPYRFLSIELEEIAGLYPEEHRFEEILTLALRGFDKPGEIGFRCDDVTIDLSSMSVSVEPTQGEDIAEDLMEIFKELESAGPPAGGQKLTIEGFTANSHAEILRRLTSLRAGIRLPSVRMYLDNREYSDDEQWNFTRVLGAGRHGSMGYGREVPWEKEDADYGWRLILNDDDSATEQGGE